METTTKQKRTRSRNLTAGELETIINSTRAVTSQMFLPMRRHGRGALSKV